MNRSRSLRVLGLLAAVLLVAVLMSWPLAVELGNVLTSARADGDLGYTLSAHWWAGEVWSGSASFPINDQVYFPYGQNMAQSVWNFIALFLSSWTHLFFEPLAAYQAGLIWLMCLNGLAAALLGHRLGGKWGAFGASAFILAFPFPWSEAFEGRLEQSFLAPSLLLFWAAIPFRETPQKHARILGLMMAFVAASYWYYAPIAALGLAAFLGSNLRTRGCRRGLLVAFGYCILFAAPFLILVAPALQSGAYALATEDAQHILFTRVGNAVNPWEVLSGILGPTHLGRGIPLIGCLALTYVAWTQARARAWVGIMAVGLLFAMGPALSFQTEPWVVGGRLIPLPFAGLDFLPGMSRFWWPYRFLMLVGVGAAAGMALLFARLPSDKRAQWAMVLSAMLLVEGRWILMRATHAGDPTIPVSVWDPPKESHFFKFQLPEWMQDPPSEGAVLEFPMAEAANAIPLYAPYHRLPTAHGDGVREIHIRPREFEDRVRENRLFSSWAQNLLPDVDRDSLHDLHSLGFRYILVHLDREMDPAVERRNSQILGRLERVLGAASHREEALAVFNIPAP